MASWMGKWSPEQAADFEQYISNQHEENYASGRADSYQSATDYYLQAVESGDAEQEAYWKNWLDTYKAADDAGVSPQVALDSANSGRTGPTRMGQDGNYSATPTAEGTQYNAGGTQYTDTTQEPVNTYEDIVANKIQDDVALGNVSMADGGRPGDRQGVVTNPNVSGLGSDGGGEGVSPDYIQQYKDLWGAVQDPRINALYEQMQGQFSGVQQPPGGGLFGGQFDVSGDPFAPARGWQAPGEQMQTPYADLDAYYASQQTGADANAKQAADTAAQAAGDIGQAKSQMRSPSTIPASPAVPPPLPAPKPMTSPNTGAPQNMADQGYYGSNQNEDTRAREASTSFGNSGSPSSPPPPPPPPSGAQSSPGYSGTLGKNPVGAPPPGTLPGSPSNTIPGGSAPNTVSTGGTPGGGWRGQQANLAAQMMGYDASQLPSQAQQQLRMGQDAMTKQAMALAGSQPGMSPAAALRGAQRSAEATGLQTNQQMGLLRAQEAAQNQGLNLQARQLGANILQTGRGQDFETANAQQQYANDMQKFYMSQMSGLLGGQQQVSADTAKTVYQQEDSQQNAEDRKWWDLATSIVGGAVGAGGQAAAGYASK